MGKPIASRACTSAKAHGAHWAVKNRQQPLASVFHNATTELLNQRGSDSIMLV